MAPSTTGCQAAASGATASAAILVTDGTLQILCGCAEAGGTTVGAGAGTLTCTVNAGTTVDFFVLKSRVPHMIQSTGSPAFVSSPPMNVPTNSLRAYGVTFSTAGTYTYNDAYNSSLSGQIVVN
jgi:plastocyanin